MGMGDVVIYLLAKQELLAAGKGRRLGNKLPVTRDKGRYAPDVLIQMDVFVPVDPDDSLYLP